MERIKGKGATSNKTEVNVNDKKKLSQKTLRISVGFLGKTKQIKTNIKISLNY